MENQNNNSPSVRFFRAGSVVGGKEDKVKEQTGEVHGYWVGTGFSLTILVLSV